MRRKLKIAAAVLAAAVLAAALVFYLALRPGRGPAVADALPRTLAAAARFAEASETFVAIAAWEPLGHLAGGRTFRALGVELEAGPEGRGLKLPPEVLELAPVILGRECAAGVKVTEGGAVNWLFLSKIGFGFTAREWALRHFGPEGMVSAEPLEGAGGAVLTRVNVSGAGELVYTMEGDLLLASDSPGLISEALAAASGGERFELSAPAPPAAGAAGARDERMSAAAVSLRSALPGASGAPEEVLAQAFAFTGLPWPAGAAALTVEDLGDGRLGAKAAIGFDPALIPDRSRSLVDRPPSEWTGLEAVPADALFHWSWRAADAWHLGNLFGQIASEAGRSVRDSNVVYEISNIVFLRVGPHLVGDFAAFAAPQKTRDPEGGYPAVTWLFRTDDPDAVRREILTGALRWATGVRSAGDKGGGAALAFPYLEAQEYRGARVYLLRGSFVHRDHGYEPCFTTTGDLLICSTSISGLKRSMDALAGEAPRLELPRLPGPAGGRSFLLYADRPESMRQTSNLYDYQVEMYRTKQMTPEEALTDTTDYRARYEAFAEIARLFDRVVITGRYEPGGELRVWAELEPTRSAPVVPSR